MQAPTKYELVINLKTAKALGLTVPPTVLAARRRGDRMKRREFITLLGGAAACVAARARAQQPERMRRIGVLLPAAADDAEFQARVAAFLQGLAQLGWTIGRNVRIDTRWAGANAAEIRRHAAELVALAPDVILAHGASTVGPLLQATRTVPIVFPVVGDPVGAGFVDSLARPGGNATGFMTFEYSMSGKWLELLKEIAPGVTRAAVLRDPTQGAGTGQFAVIQAVAPSLRVEVSPVNVRDAGEIERAVAAFARAPNGGLIVTAGGLATLHRDLIITLAARHKLPAVYFERFFVAAGGLISYGPDFVDQYRRAAGYVDRILKGEKPADLPVQAPTKYELVINLKTAKALGLDVPPIAARARRRGDRMKRREFITLLGGAAALARSPRARSRASGCGASACSCPQPRTMRNFRPASGRSCRGWRNWAGPSAATCGSTPAGPRPMPPTFADTRRNWPRSRRTSSWPMAPRPWGRCCRRPAPCRSCSRSSAIRSAPASSTAWRGRAATPPVS